MTYANISQNSNVGQCAMLRVGRVKEQNSQPNLLILRHTLGAKSL